MLEAVAMTYLVDYTVYIIETKARIGWFREHRFFASNDEAAMKELEHFRTLRSPRRLRLVEVVDQDTLREVVTDPEPKPAPSIRHR